MSKGPGDYLDWGPWPSDVVRCTTPDCGRSIGPPVGKTETADPNGRCWWCAHGISPQPKPGAKELKR